MIPHPPCTRTHTHRLTAPLPSYLTILPSSNASHPHPHSQVRMQKNAKLQNRFGNFNHNDIIGKPFGHKAKSYDANCFIYVLEPTPELWSNAFKTRTQIVNEIDQSLVTFMLSVKPGDVVVESGTGSGCMTMSLARAVSHPDRSKAGHVYTFEYNKFRADEAEKEMQIMGVDHLVTVKCHDVCAKYTTDEVGGGGFPGVAAHTVDALFLDVPEPKSAIGYALEVMKPQANICCYSPCISQVTDTCEKLRELHFTNIRMVEIRQRPADGREIAFENIDLGTVAVESAAPSPSATTQVKTETGTEDGDGDEEGENYYAYPIRKKRKRESENASVAAASSSSSSSGGADADAPRSRQTPQVPKKPSAPDTTFRVCRHLPSMKSHTAFLTFACSPLPEFELAAEVAERNARREAGKAAGDDKRGAKMPQGVY